MNVELALLDKQKLDIVELLEKVDLTYDEDIEVSLVLYEEQLIGTVSLSGNVIKCLAVHPDYENKGLALRLIDHAIKFLNNKGVYHYFLYTKPDFKTQFISMGFKEIVEVGDVVLFEGGSNTITNYLTSLRSNYNYKEAACIVMNMNPMTNGHLYLIEKAAKENENVVVFIVEEDLSYFPFSLREEIAKEVLKHLPNVLVIPSGPYMVSRSTFSTYFYKDKANVNKKHAEIDYAIFLKCYKEIFNLTKRYVGTEPYCKVTNSYNEVMLENDFPIVLVPRLSKDDKAVSASLVRELLKEDIEKIKTYVPGVCYEKLRQYFNG